MNLGENIYRYRTSRNLSQTSLADALDVSRQSISKWENNSAMPELDKLIKMSALFEITLDELVFGPKEAKPAEEPIPTPQQPVSAQVAPIPFRIPMRLAIGFVMLLFGMIFFLLSIFWGNHLYWGEEFGEFASLVILLISVALLATYNLKALTVCAIAYTVYSLVCFRLNVTNPKNYLFTFIVSIVLVVWFLMLGKGVNKQEDDKHNE